MSAGAGGALAAGKRIDALMIGAGQRGFFVYGQYAIEHPQRLRFIALVEPDRYRRERFASLHKIAPERSFESVEEALDSKLPVEAAFIASMDREHLQAALAVMNAGIHLLLEKPMAPNAEDCLRIVEAASKSKQIFYIAHVLRYTSFFSKVKEIIDSGRLGEIVSLEHFENLAYWHMAHSFVRGNWSQEAASGPMILSKCCHDLDLIVWMMSATEPEIVSSLGSLTHFRPEKAPANVPERCTDGCPVEDSCPYSAPAFYLDEKRDPYFIAAITKDPSREAVIRALKEGPYGKCVYKAGNDVVDHQTVSIEFKSGALATLIMHGFADKEGRSLRIDGSRASLRAVFPLNGSMEIELDDHKSGKREIFEIQEAGSGGHRGGDGGLISAFLDAIARGRLQSQDDLSSPQIALKSHLLAFAAEESRKEGKKVHLSEFVERHHVY